MKRYVVILLQFTVIGGLVYYLRHLSSYVEALERSCDQYESWLEIKKRGKKEAE